MQVSEAHVDDHTEQSVPDAGAVHVRPVLHYYWTPVLDELVS